MVMCNIQPLKILPLGEILHMCDKRHLTFFDLKDSSFFSGGIHCLIWRLAIGDEAFHIYIAT